MTFRLTTLLYLFALLASSMAVFGPLGLMAGGVIFASWAVFYWQPRKRYDWLKAALILLLPLGLLGLFSYPLFTEAMDLSPQSTSLNNMKNISLGVMQYHAINGRYPPPYVTDKEGKPLYSWRVLVLPYVEEPGSAKQFRYDQPWNSPSNLALLQDLPQLQSPRYLPPFSREEVTTGETHYFAIVGDGTIWDPNKKVTESDVTDGLDQTILLIEVQGTGIKWSEPRDFTLEEAVALLHDTSDQEWIDRGYFVSYRYDRPPLSYRCVAIADGRADAVYSGNDPADLRAMLTRAGGEAPRELIDWRAAAEQRYLGPIVHWGRIWGLLFWIAIIFLPAYRRLPIFPPRQTCPHP